MSGRKQSRLSHFFFKPSEASLAYGIGLVLAAAPVVFLRYYQKSFGYDRIIVVFGWLVIASAMSSVYTALLFLASVGPRARTRVWARLFEGWLVFALVTIPAIDLLAWASNSAWGDTLTADMVATFARHPGALRKLLPYSARAQDAWLIFLSAALAAFVFCSFWVSRLISRQIFTSVQDWLIEVPGPSTRVRRRALLFGALCAGILLTAVDAAFIARHGPRRLAGEPISSFLKWFPSADVLEMNSARVQAAIEDQAALASYPRNPVFARKNVVLIISDAMRADHLGVYGYGRETTPFLSKLFREGKLHRVDMALSTCSESYCGIASTMASRPFHQISDGNLKIQSLLRMLGYRIFFFLSGDHRSWKYLRSFYGDDVDLFYDHVTNGHYSDSDDRLIHEGLQTLAPFAGQPAFFYFHLMSSHAYGSHFPEYERFKPDTLNGLLGFWNERSGRRGEGDSAKGGGTLSSDDLRSVRNRYDNGILQADAVIAGIFGELREKRFLDDSIVVILGDHGDGLGEHGHLGHTRYLYQEDIRIPMLIYDSQGFAYPKSGFATQLDVAPTVIDRLGLPIPASWQGRSLLRPSLPKVTLHQTRRGLNLCRAVVADRGAALYKYIRCGAPDRPSEELYDLTADPGEMTDLMARTPPEWVARLRRELDSRFGVDTQRCLAQECVE